jgi:hypothetical protein
MQWSSRRKKRHWRREAMRQLKSEEVLLAVKILP